MTLSALFRLRRYRCHLPARGAESQGVAAWSVVGESTFGELLGGAAAAKLHTLGRVRTFVRDATLMREASASDEVFFITNGRVKIVTVSPSGREAVLGVRGEGDLIGDVSAIDGRPRSASAVALEPVEVRAIATSSFVQFLAETPEASLGLLRLLTSRLRDADAKRLEHAGHDATARLASRLIELGERFGEPIQGQRRDGVRISLPLTQEELAGWTGSSLEATAKALRVLRCAGVVTTGRKRIEITDISALHGWATPDGGLLPARGDPTLHVERRGAAANDD